MMISIVETYRRIGLNPSVAQLAFAKAVLGEPLNAEELAAYREHTGREDYPAARPDEATLIKGRKSGGTEYIAAPLAIHLAGVEPHNDPGIVQLVAPSKSDQARIGWQAVNRHLQRGFPDLVADVKESEGRILLHTGDEIRIASANFRTLRGPKYLAVFIDEAAFFYSDSADDGGANPLPFILDSVAGGMIATEHPLLCLISSPWVQSGTLFEHYRDRNLNPDRLVWRAPTLAMNPHANQRLMEKHRRDRGENFFCREYLAQFSEDSFAYIEASDVDAAISSNMPFFPPKSGVRYAMGLDPGRKRDHFGAAIAHRERRDDGDYIIVDWAAEWRPGPVSGLKYADILPEIWARARAYRVRKIASDQVDFGGLEASVPKVNGHPEFEMERVMTGGQSGAELADVTRALFAQRKLILPDQSGLAAEFKRLTDYLSQGGSRDIRARRGADDRSRAIMLAVHQAFNRPTMKPWVEILSLNSADDALERADGPTRIWHRI